MNRETDVTPPRWVEVLDVGLRLPLPPWWQDLPARPGSTEAGVLLAATEGAPALLSGFDANLVVTTGPSAGPGATLVEQVDRQRVTEGELRSRLRGYRLLELSAGAVGTPPREAVHRAAVHVQGDGVPVGMLQWIVPGERDLTLTWTMACEAMPRLSDLVRALVAAAQWTSSSTPGPADGEEAADV